VTWDVQRSPGPLREGSGRLVRQPAHCLHRGLDWAIVTWVLGQPVTIRGASVGPTAAWRCSRPERVRPVASVSRSRSIPGHRTARPACRPDRRPGRPLGLRRPRAGDRAAPASHRMHAEGANGCRGHGRRGLPVAIPRAPEMERIHRPRWRRGCGPRLHQHGRAGARCFRPPARDHVPARTPGDNPGRGR
jgi:hypothetical protein